MPTVRADWSPGPPFSLVPCPCQWVVPGHRLVGKFTRSLLPCQSQRALLRASAATLSDVQGEGGIGQDRSRSHHRSVKHPGHTACLLLSQAAATPRLSQFLSVSVCFSHSLSLWFSVSPSLPAPLCFSEVFMMSFLPTLLLAQNWGSGCALL